MEWVRVNENTCIATYKAVSMEEVMKELDKIKSSSDGYNCPRLVKDNVWTLYSNCKGYAKSFYYIFHKITEDDVAEIKNHIRK